MSSFIKSQSPRPNPKNPGTAGTRAVSSRRGAALMFVVGILALIAVILLVFASTGIGDSRTAGNVSKASSADDQAAAVAGYLQQVVGDSTFATIRQRQVLTTRKAAETDRRASPAPSDVNRRLDDPVLTLNELTDKVYRRAWTIPGVDPELVSLGGIFNVPHRQFNPTGTISTPWTTQYPLALDDSSRQVKYIPEAVGFRGTLPTSSAIDPRIGVDPWLATIEPARLNRSNRDNAGRYGWEYGLRATPIDDIRDRFKARTDLVSLSNFGPDGRPINLAAIRGNFGASSIGEMSAYVTLLVERDRQGGDDPVAGVLNESRLSRTRGASDGLLSGTYLPLYGQTSGSVNNPLNNTYVGGQAYNTARPDLADPNRPAHWFTNQIGMYRPVGDNRFAPGDPRNLDNQFRDTDGDGFYDSRISELVDCSLGFDRPVISTSENIRLFFAARAIDLSAFVNVNTALSFQQSPMASSPLLNRDAFRSGRTPSTGWAMAGSSPADIDLERLLSIRGIVDGRGTTGTQREVTLYGLYAQPASTLPSFYGRYETLLAGTTGRRIADEVGGSAFSSLVFTRLYGERSDLGRTFKTVIDGSAVTGANSGIARSNSDSRYDSVFGNPVRGSGALGAIERSRLFYLTRPDRAMGLNFRGDLPGSGGNTGETILSLGGRFGTADELELRSFQGLNRVGVTTSLEQVLDGRSNTQTDAIGRGPMRSNRPLSLEMAANLDTNPTTGLIDPPLDGDRANWATGLLRNQTSVRNYLTTISAQRPLITDPSRPLLSQSVDSLNPLTSPADQIAASNRALAAAMAQPLGTADLPTALEPIVDAIERTPARVRAADTGNWTLANPYVSTTPLDRIPRANFEQSVAIAQLFRGYLDSLAPDLAGRPSLWEGGASRGQVGTVGVSGRPRTRSLSFGDRSIGEARAEFAAGDTETSIGAFDSAGLIYDTRGTDFDLNLAEVQRPTVVRNSQPIVVPVWKPQLSGMWLGNTAELSARVSAHLAVNFLDMNDPTDRPSAFTLILDPALKGRAANLADATGTQVQNYGLRPASGNADPITATAPITDQRNFDGDAARTPDAVGYMLPTQGRAWDAFLRMGNVGIAGPADGFDRPSPGATAVNNGFLARPSVFGRLPDYRLRGMLDMDVEIPGDRRAGQTGPLPTRYARPYATSLDGIVPNRIDVATGNMTATPKEHALEQQSTPPMINIIGIKPQPFITAAMSLVMYTDALNVEVTEAQNGGNEGRRIRLPMINGEKRFGNPDFIGEIIAFQLHNPFDRPISLTLPSPVRQRPVDADAGSTAAADDALRTWRKAHGRVEDTRLDDAELSAAERQAIQYYVEFAGRYYAMAELVRNSGNQTSAEKVYPITMQPGETRFFYAMARDPEDVVRRWRYASRAAEDTGTGVTVTDSDINLFYHWINRQLGIENDVTVNDGTVAAPRLRTERKFLPPVRLLPFNPINNTSITPYTQPSQDALTALAPNTPRLGAALSGTPPVTFANRAANASDTEVRLWRAISDELEPTDFNALSNDMLVDRLRQPVDARNDTDYPFLTDNTARYPTVFGTRREFPRLNVGFEPRRRPSYATGPTGNLGPAAGPVFATSFLQPPAPPTDVDVFQDPDPTQTRKPEGARGNGYATVLYSAILRPGMRYDFPRAMPATIGDSDDVALPRGVLPPWLLEAKAGVLSRNEVFDSFDRLAIRKDQLTRAAFNYSEAPAWANNAISPTVRVTDSTQTATAKPRNAANYKFQLRPFLDRALDTTVLSGRTSEGTLASNDRNQADTLTRLHYTKPYFGTDRLTTMVRMTASQPLTGSTATMPLPPQAGFSVVARPAGSGGPRPSFWTITTPTAPATIPPATDGEPTDVDAFRFVGVIGRDMLYPLAKRLRNPIDPPELNNTYSNYNEILDKIQYHRNDWPLLSLRLSRPDAEGLTPLPKFQLANNGVLRDGTTLTTTEARYGKADRSAPNLSGLYYRAIVDQLPATLKIARQQSDAAIDAGEPRPQLRLTDLLLAWAIGPYEIPLRYTNRDADLRQDNQAPAIVPVTNLDERFTTLSEAIALALDYDAPINYRLTTTETNPARFTSPIFDRKDAFFRIGQMVSSAPQDVHATAEDNNPNFRDYRAFDPSDSSLNTALDPRRDNDVITASSRYFPIRGVVLDSGRLSLTACTPFSDVDGSTRFELVRDGPTGQHGNGIPLALNIMNRFRLTAEGGVAEAIVGRVNLNTAPKAVMSVLPLVTPDPLNITPPNSRAVAGAIGDTTGWAKGDVLPMSVTNELLAARGSSGTTQRERFLTQLLDTPTRSNVNNTNGVRDDIRIDDLAASILSYRDKVPQFVLPRFINPNRFEPSRIDFSDSNFAPVDRELFGGTYDAKGRRMASGILPLRESRGFQSFGELMAVRFADQAPVAFSQPLANGGTNPLANQRALLDPAAFPVPGYPVPQASPLNPTLAASRNFVNPPVPLPLDRTQLRTAGMDKLGRQERALRHSGLLTEVHRDPDEGDPFANNPVTPVRDLFNNSLPTRNLSGSLGTTNEAPVPTEQAQLLPPKVAANYESRLAVLAALSQTTTLRSDTFCVWFTVEGYTRDDVAGLAISPAGVAAITAGDLSAGDASGFANPAIARTMAPTLKRRFVMILDRSNVVKPGDRPKVLTIQELPWDSSSVPE